MTDETPCANEDCGHPLANHAEPIGCDWNAVNKELINGKDYVEYGCTCTVFVLPEVKP